MLVAIAVLCALCEAIFTAMEVALGALSRARLRALAEEEIESAREEPARDAVGGHFASETSGSETSATDARKQTSSRRGKRARSRPERLLALLEHSDRLSLTFITVTSLSLWTAGTLLSWQALRDGWSVWSLALALGGVLFFAEAVPLVIAARNPEAIALRGVRLVEKSVQVLAPLATLLGGLGAAVARLFGARSHARPQVSEVELRQALDQAEHEGVIEPEERAMLESAIDFRAKSVADVMTPRRAIVAVPAMMPLRAVLKVAMEQGHSRLPVYEGSTDQIVGIVATKDLLPHLRPRSAPGSDVASASSSAAPEPTPSGDALTARDVARPAFFLPASKRVAVAIDDLRRQRMLMAIVVEPNGGTAGLVTLEDLLEEIVGEIEDEYDEAEAPLRLLEFEPRSSAEATNGTLADGPSASGASSDGVNSHSSESARPGGIVANASCTVRQAEQFWRRHFRESLVLFERAPGASTAGAASTSGAMGETAQLGPAASESMSLAALAQQLLDGVPEQGQRVMAGAALPPGTARAGAVAASGAPVEMEITRASGPRLEEVSLVRVAAPATETPEVTAIASTKPAM